MSFKVYAKTGSLTIAGIIASIPAHSFSSYYYLLHQCISSCFSIPILYISMRRHLHCIMKKIFLSLSCCVLSAATFAQTKNSLLSEEMKRLNRLGDSLHRVQLARESTSVARMNELLRNAEQDVADAKYKEVEKATEQVLAQHRKEQKRKRNAAMLTIAAFALAGLAGTIIIKRRNKHSRG